MTPTYYSEISEGAILLHQQILAAARTHFETKPLYKDAHLYHDYAMECNQHLLLVLHNK